jgi:hypothetical protein
MGYLNEDGLATLVGKVKGQMVQLTSEQYRNLPSTKNTDNKIYFVEDEDYARAIDNEPTLNSNNFVKSGGVYTYTSKIGTGSLTTTAKTLIPAVNELKASIDTLNTGLTAVTEEFAYIRGYFANSADWTEYNAYPTGFNRTNCSIVGFEVYNADAWKNGIGYTATQNARTFAAMDNNGVRVYNTDTVLFGEVYRITLRKLTI